MRNFLIVSFSLFFLSACSDKKVQQVKTVNLNPTTYGKNVSKAELAEEIALAGEQLVDPARFMYADLLFDVALQTDPNNKRAGFYKSFLASFMSMRGLGARVENAIKAHGNESDLAEYQKIVKNFPNSSVKTFLLDNSGKSDIEHEADVQAFLDEYRAGQDKFRQFVKNNKDLNLTLNVNILAAGAMIEDAAEHCDAELVSNETIEMAEQCDYLTALQVKLDRADLEALQHAQAGLQIYLTALTAYDLSGLKELANLADKIEEEESREISELEIVEFARSQSQLGKLRNENLLKSIITMGVDALNGVKWANKIQNQLCPTGEPIRGERKRNLVRSDICLQDKVEWDGTVVKTVEEQIDTAERILQNKTIAHSDTIGWQRYNTLIRPAAPFYTPVKDLLTLAPTEFDECGNALNLGDKTLGGVYPNGDAETFILNPYIECNKPIIESIEE